MLTVLGNTTVDILVRGVPELPEPGEDSVWAQTNERVVITLGGGGGSAAYVAGALGELVRLWIAVGADPAGELALRWLEGRNVDTTSVRISVDDGTSTTVVITDTAQQRRTFHYQGASGSFAPRVRAVGGGASDWLLVAGCSMLSLWRGANTEELLRNARRTGLNTALDFGLNAAEPVSLEELKPLLPHTSLFLCSRFELEQVAGDNLARGASWALDGGAGAVAVKMGTEGAMVFSAQARDGITIPAFEVETAGAIDPGAGFNVGLIFARSRGASLEESARFASATAALIAGAPRGILDAPGEAAVRAFLEKHP